MADIYRHQTVKFADAGLQLRTPLDLVPPNQYSRLTNALPVVEGQLITRAGLNLLADVAFDGLATLNGITYTSVGGAPVNPVSSPIYIRFTVTTAAGEVAVSPEMGPYDSASTVYVQATLPAYLGATNWTAYFGYSSSQLAFTQTWTEATVAGLSRVVTINSLTATTRPTGPIHTMFRLNQQTTAISPERIMGVGAALYSAQVPSGAYSLIDANGYDGNPLTVVPFRFDSDPSSWAIIANANQMKKRRRPSLYWTLGEIAPTAPATYTVGAAGAVTGNNYDWRYTYVNSVVNTESNPSGLNVSAGTQRPTTNTTPDTISGGTACSNPANAYDGNATTYATFVGSSITSTTQSARFFGWAPIGSVSGLVLQIDSEVDLIGTVGTVTTSLFYSADNGASWNTIYSTTGARARQTDTVALPTGTDLTKLIVRAVSSFGSGGGGDTGGGGGGFPCPLHGAPVRLYGDPEWWNYEIEPWIDFIEITTETGRTGTFNRKHRLYTEHGLIPLGAMEAGCYVFVDEPNLHLEKIIELKSLVIPDGQVDHYEATEGHIYSAWGFVGHNLKKEGNDI